MKRILNYMLLGIRILSFIAIFLLNVFIILSMYHRIDKNIIESLPVFLPCVLLLILFFINTLYKQKKIINNLFYNLTCCLAFISILIVQLRSIFDKGMLLNEIMGYGINFSYYNDFIPFMKIMFYGLIIANICFILENKINKKTVDKEEVL